MARTIAGRGAAADRRGPAADDPAAARPGDGSRADADSDDPGPRGRAAAGDAVGQPDGRLPLRRRARDGPVGDRRRRRRSRAGGRDVADELGERMWDVRREFFVPCPDAEEAVRLAMAAAERPVVLVDLGDNIGGGSAGDGTVLLAELLRQRAADAVVVLYDPEARRGRPSGRGRRTVRAAGRRASRRLHGEPVAVRGVVRSLHDGTWVEDQPRHGGRRFNDQGATAVIAIDGPILLVLNSLRTPPFSLGQLTSLGIDPVATGDPRREGGRRLQGGVRADCRTRSSRWIRPGLTAIDPGRFHVSRHYPGRPMFPLDDCESNRCLGSRLSRRLDGVRARHTGGRPRSRTSLRPSLARTRFSPRTFSSASSIAWIGDGAGG